MSSKALEIVRFVEANGGQFEVEGSELVIRPGEAAMPVLESLREYKCEIIALLQCRSATAREHSLIGEWMLEQCVYVDGWSGGIGPLYLSLARWLADRGQTVPGSRHAFKASLADQGLHVTHEDLVYGLILKEDWLYLKPQRNVNDAWSTYGDHNGATN